MKYNIQEVIDTLIDTGSYKATKYISPKQIIRAVRTRYKYSGNKKIEKRGNIEINLTIGRPNYLEREFVKLLVKSKEPFPVKKVQLKS